MSPPRRALIAVTSANALLMESKHVTGLFIAEALHPYNVLTAAGFEVDLASETGKYTADWLSEQPDFLNGKDLETWKDTNSEFRKKLDNMPKASELDPSNLQNIAAQVWANGGIVSSVCHGPAIFANLIDPATKEHLIKRKKITGFTTEAERDMGLEDTIKSWNVELVEDLAKRVGATYERGSGVWDDFHIVDGHLITGQNPQSSVSTAKAIVDVFDKL